MARDADAPCGAGDEDEADAEAERWLSARRAFVVLGAMKCGTTALRVHLAATAWEDNASLPSQEPHFFDEDCEYRRGAAHYASWFRWGDAWPPPDVIGDVTPSYMYIPDAVPRIRRLLPQAQVLVMLRNPVDRALSHQNHDLAKGRDVEPLPRRVQREQREAARASRGDVFGRGLYAAQLRRILAHFPRERLHVVVSERYRCDPRGGLRRIRAFLGLPAAEQADVDAVLPEVHVRGTYMETLTPECRARLRDAYAEDVAGLRALLRDPLAEWASDFPLPIAAPERQPATHEADDEMQAAGHDSEERCG